MIISEEHILQEKLNNLTRTRNLTRIPLHLIIKNIEKALIQNRNNLLSQRAPPTVTNILPIITPFSDTGKLFTATVHKNWHSDTTLSTI